MNDVETTQIRVSAESILQAALEGTTYTHSIITADQESPETHNVVLEFHETPQEAGEAIQDNPVIQNRMPEGE